MINVSWDWIEYTATARNVDVSENCFLFTLKKNERGSQYFRESFNVTTCINGEMQPFATLEVKPRVSFIAPDLVKVKISNLFCYMADLHHYIEMFNSECGLIFKNFTRLDIAGDFQKVNNYETCYDLLEALCSRSLIIKNKHKFNIHGFGHSYNGVTYGARTSGVSCTLYNKTLEMDRKTIKPWIQETWAKAGFEAEKDTYRLEFSCKKPDLKKKVVSLGNSEGWQDWNFFKLGLLQQPHEAYKYLLDTHFIIGKNDGSRWTDEGKLQDVFIFDRAECEYHAIKSSHKAQSNNYTKAYLKKLSAHAIKLYHEDKILESHVLNEQIDYLVSYHGLGRWQMKNIPESIVVQSHYNLLDAVMIAGLKTKNLLLSNQIAQYELFT